MKNSLDVKKVIEAIREYEQNCFMTGSIGSYSCTVYEDSKSRLMCNVTKPCEINIIATVYKDGMPMTDEVIFLSEKGKNGIELKAVSRRFILPNGIARKAEALLKAYHEYLRTLN